MKFGQHVDGGVRIHPHDGRKLRTDISATLFLSDPDSYDGGELVIESASGEDAVKLAAGSLLAYPSTTLHHVAPVTRGVRLAAVGWARSLIRDAARREMLFDLDTARRQLFAREGKSAEYDLVSKSLANLMRMWVED
jgi:PKHD-type hydroxylase